MTLGFFVFIMQAMRKWFFIILLPALIVAFSAIYYLVSSTEHSYLNINFNPLNKTTSATKSKSFNNPFSVESEGENRKTSTRKRVQNPLSNKPKPYSKGEGAGPKKGWSMSSTALQTYQMDSESSGSPSNSVVLKLPHIGGAGDDSAKAVFILGTPPIVSFSLKFINEQVVPYDFPLKDVPVGGLSALSYDPEKNVFIVLSDDKGNTGYPPRFYELKLNVKNIKGKTRQYELQLIKQTPLRNRNGQILSQVDPEGVAFFKPDRIFISTEGDQRPDFSPHPPELLMFSSRGRLLSSWGLPEVYWPGPENLDQVGKWGVKENKGFEALSISPDKSRLYLATELSLHQDDQEGNNKEQYVRIGRFSMETGKLAGQFVYQMDSDINWENFSGTNGLTDFISLGEQKLITVERVYLKDSSVSSARKTDLNMVRLFLTDCSLASDVSQHKKLQEGKFVTCGKTLLTDLSSILGRGVDNIEGITIGPEVAKGTHLLVLVSDNNFSQTQKTQFLFFHYSPNKKNPNNILSSLINIE